MCFFLKVDFYFLLSVWSFQFYDSLHNESITLMVFHSLVSVWPHIIFSFVFMFCATANFDGCYIAISL